jgi:hypothetical protein
LISSEPLSRLCYLIAIVTRKGGRQESLLPLYQDGRNVGGVPLPLILG